MSLVQSRMQHGWGAEQCRWKSMAHLGRASLGPMPDSAVLSVWLQVSELKMQKLAEWRTDSIRTVLMASPNTVWSMQGPGPGLALLFAPSTRHGIPSLWIFAKWIKEWMKKFYSFRSRYQHFSSRYVRSQVEFLRYKLKWSIWSFLRSGQR